MVGGAADVLALYRERINAHRFAELAPLIAADAVFWFSDGSHRGLDAIRSPFEATWTVLRDETYWLEDVEWLALSDTGACCIFFWRANVVGVERTGAGRGTTALARGESGWQIVHEHLSPAPAG